METVFNGICEGDPPPPLTDAGRDAHLVSADDDSITILTVLHEKKGAENKR